MSKLAAAYRAILIEKNITGKIKGSGFMVETGSEGDLQIYISERLHPGEQYIVFAPDDQNYRLQTSCGNIEINDTTLTIYTQNGINMYSFKIMQKSHEIIVKIKAPERFLHVCCSCGKRQILSSKEAFEQSWDYPGPDGIYASRLNHGFGILAPRTCGECSITQSLYWRLMTDGEMLKSDKETLERIQNEPLSLIIDEEV